MVLLPSLPPAAAPTFPPRCLVPAQAGPSPGHSSANGISGQNPLIPGSFLSTWHCLALNTSGVPLSSAEGNTGGLSQEKTSLSLFGCGSPVAQHW